MSKEKQSGRERPEQDDILLSGVKAAEDFWKAAAEMWPLSFAAFRPTMPTAGGDTLKLQKEFWAAMQDFWRTGLSTEKQPAAREDGRDEKETGPSAFGMDAIQPFWGELMRLHRQWSDAGQRGMQIPGEEDMGHAIQRVSRTVLDMYGEEFRKLLNLPQLGLTRFYQERVNIAVEKFSSFQSAIHDFVMILLKPAGKAFQEMQEEVGRLSGQGEDVLQDTKKCYQIWMKKMEDQYLQLLRSPEYTESLGNTLRALKDYRVAREQWMMDLLQDVPVPTRKDMDDLYRELYNLKKKIRNLEKGGEKS